MPAPSPPQVSSSKTLTTLLSRLSPKILSTDPHSPLRYSSFERTKTLANLEFARTLLLRAEHDAATIKTQARKHSVQETLLKQRNQIKRLNDRLFELGQLDDGRWESEEDNLVEEGNGEGEVDDVLRAVLEDSDHEDNDAVVGMATAKKQPLSPKRGDDSHQGLPSKDGKDISLSRQRSELLGSAGGLRARSGKGMPNSSTGQDEKGSTTAHGLSPSDTAGDDSNTTTALESADTLHNDITSSLVNLAQQLKLSAQSFSDDLAADAEAIRRTEGALGKNQSGLDVATQRMGVLRRMSEGRWWGGRMMLYGVIAALWVLCILVVFVMPKLRF